jgi:anaerobic ribonucleoside-triphosphate reductase
MSPTTKQPKRQKCEIYSRVVGYLSPVHRWNKGKKSEFIDRKAFNILTK